MWTAEMLATERGVFEIFTQSQGDPLCIPQLHCEFDERGDYFADRFVDEFRVVIINLKEAGTSCKISEASVHGAG
ncbi:hypothetical protein [Paenibacillus thiaminolyticus]|uniref:Uncharacterized protein n=1 Tax=Paenibacillus thiaminolyticus TaxID=49283 RepID=A0A3A3GID4_PANTH|nr:hypothetical protein [Paenibacillus thiaminolyticus]RJG22902.1 hypothetical protein DQX05_15205 [Paenibacillus thiaminolyticus]